MKKIFDPKIHTESQETSKSHTSKKRPKVDVSHFDFKIYYKATIIKSVPGYRQRQVYQQIE